MYTLANIAYGLCERFFLLFSLTHFFNLYYDKCKSMMYKRKIKELKDQVYYISQAIDKIANAV